MAERELCIVVAGDNDASVIDAVRDLRDTAVRRGVDTEIELLVATHEREQAVADLLETVVLPERTGVKTTVTDDPVAVIQKRATERPVNRILLDQTSEMDVSGFERQDFPVELLTAEREVDRQPLVRDRGLAGLLSTFLLSYAFYLALGDPTDPFDLITGAITAAVVAGALSAVVPEPEPSVTSVFARGVRATLFLPYLLWEILKANLGVAYVILHPDLPIQPELIEYEPALDGEFPRAILANAITLTPGTLTVDADADRFLVHTLTPGTRAALVEGSLERAVSWVFHGGRKA